MRIQVTFTIYAWAQPSRRSWQKATELVKKWNDRSSEQWQLEDTASKDNAYYYISLEDASEQNIKELKKLLEKYRDSFGVEFAMELNEGYTREDFQKADMVRLFGFQPYDFGVLYDLGLTELPKQSDEQMRFAGNLKEFYKTEAECPGCYWVEPFSGQRVNQLTVDEYCLDKEYNTKAGKWVSAVRPWDIMTLPGGVTLISRRVLHAFQQSKILGFHILNVISKNTGRPSSEIFELIPNRYIRQVCTQHTAVSGGLCHICGRILGDVEGSIYLRKDWIGSDDIIGRTPGGLRLVYCGRRVYQILTDIDAQGASFDEPLYFCQHKHDHLMDMAET